MRICLPVPSCLLIDLLWSVTCLIQLSRALSPSLFQLACGSLSAPLISFTLVHSLLPLTHSLSHGLSSPPASSVTPLSFSLSLGVSRSRYPSMYPSNQPTNQHIHPSIHPSIYLSIHLFISISFSVSISCFSITLTIYRSISHLISLSLFSESDKGTDLTNPNAHAEEGEGDYLRALALKEQALAALIAALPADHPQACSPIQLNPAP
jgi:hypothetical protein